MPTPHQARSLLRRFLLASALLSLLSSPSLTAQSRSGFMGYAPPGMEPEVFSPDVLSGSAWPHSRLIVAPDGRALLYNANPAPHTPAILYRSVFDGESLSPPRAMEEGHPLYSAKFEYSPDGGRLFVAYRVPAPGGEGGTEIPVLVYMDRTSEGWGQPVPILANTDGAWASLGQPSVTLDGTLYLGARPSDSPTPTVVRIRPRGNGYGEPEEVSEALGGMPAADPFVDPAGKYLLFSGMVQNSGRRLDLFVSFRKADGGWMAPILLGDGISSEYHERFPSVSGDGRFLFFVRAYGETFGSSRAEYYWVDARVLERVRDQAGGWLSAPHGALDGRQGAVRAQVHEPCTNAPPRTGM